MMRLIPVFYVGKGIIKVHKIDRDYVSGLSGAYCAYVHYFRLKRFGRIEKPIFF